MSGNKDTSSARHKYFAYGSNMNSAQMKHRCTAAILDGAAVLEGYRFLINSRGVASVAEDNLANVHGLVWSITDDDLKNLDRYEGVRNGYYSRRVENIVFEREPVRAWIYVASDNTTGKPRPGYLQTIVEAARAAHFPDVYIEKLESTA